MWRWQALEPGDQPFAIDLIFAPAAQHCSHGLFCDAFTMRTGDDSMGSFVLRANTFFKTFKTATCVEFPGNPTHACYGPTVHSFDGSTPSP
jgi:hypothetical protein